MMKSAAFINHHTRGTVHRPGDAARNITRRTSNLFFRMNGPRPPFGYHEQSAMPSGFSRVIKTFPNDDQQTSTNQLDLPTDDRFPTPQLPDERLENIESPTSTSPKIQPRVKPEGIRRHLGITEYIPLGQPKGYPGDRSYDYEKKYPIDPPGQETSEDARFFKVYLDEAEVYDQEMIRSHRDSLDSLLVFASLFSAVVSAFVIQTSQALQPDQALITNYLLLQQIQILQAIGNATALAGIQPSAYYPDSPTHTTSDVWVNGLFFTSLALSLSTALLSVLAKQWLQAYDSTTSGNTRDRALVRHLRFMGAERWKLDEIIGALPLVLHTSLAIFFFGLVVFLWSLYEILSWIMIIIAGIAFSFYLGSIILPAFDIQCPYRLPLLYRPIRSLVLVLRHIRQTLTRWSLESLGWIMARMDGLNQEPLALSILTHIRHTLASASNVVRIFLSPIHASISQFGRHAASYGAPPASLKASELAVVQDLDASTPLVHHGMVWLHSMSSNATVQRIAAQGLAGDRCNTLRWPKDRIPSSFHSIYAPRFIETVIDGLIREDPWFKGSIWLRAFFNLQESAQSIRLEQRPPTNITRFVHRAAELGLSKHLESIIIKFDGQVDLNAKHQSRQTFIDETPLFAASRNGHPSVVRLLLSRQSKGAPVVDVNMEAAGGHGSALQAASLYGHTKIVELLLAHDADVTLAGGDTGTPLYAASLNGHVDVVALLLSNGNAQVDRDGGTFFGSALQAASAHGHVAVVQLLLEWGADVNRACGAFGSALIAASVGGRLETVQLLLDHKAEVNQEGCWDGVSPRWIHPHLQEADLQLENEGVRRVDGWDYGTALQGASAYGRLDIIKLLLQRGANVNAQCGWYGSPLQAATARGFMEIVKLLLENGAQVNMKGGFFGSALQAAALNDRMGVAQLLLDNGSDVNLESGEHGTALYAAMAKGNFPMADLLRSYGAV